jgi:hypothetical protein
VIMASKLARFERELTELNDLADERIGTGAPASRAPDPAPEEPARR